MEWEDTRIIHLRNEERKKRYCDLNTGMYIKEQLVCFEKWGIEELEINLILPSGFLKLNPDFVNKKYPSLDQPDIVIGNESGDVVFAFSSLQEHIADVELGKHTIGTLRTLIKSANPSINFYDEGIIQNEFMSCCWFDFKSYVITGAIYNLTSIISFKSRTILGMFSCPYDLRLWWKAVFLKILETIKQQSGGEYESNQY